MPKPECPECRARTKDELIIEVWQALDCRPVGRRELEQIQQEIGTRFGAGAVTSPASLARTLAEAGAVLRHPEILDFDSEWREDQLRAHPLAELSFGSLEDAARSLELLESWRREYAERGSQTELASLRELGLKIKDETLLITTSKHVNSKRRKEAGEIVLWLTIWLQQPTIFNDWLSLRQRSREFVQLLNKTKD